MCLVLLDWQPQTENWLNLVSNRDEFFARPTLPLQAWQEMPTLYAGIDVQHSGTWLGVNTDPFRFAVLTNVRAQDAFKDGRSRGHLVRDALISSQPIMQFACAIEMSVYSSFNLLLGNQTELLYISNYPRCCIQSLDAGVYTLSNASLNTPWAKTLAAKASYQKWQQVPQSDLIYLLTDRQTYPPTQLPDTGIGQALEQQLSAQFIQLEQYGTRSSHSLVAQGQQLEMREVQWDKTGIEVAQRCEHLILE